MASEKTPVIEWLFEKYWDEENNRLTKTIMTLEDVIEGIRACNEQDGKKRSDRNPANFIKDFLRGSNATSNWPALISERRYTAKQKTGDGNAFEFVPFAEGQEESFPESFKMPNDAPTYQIETISVPQVTKSLGRADETWLIQVAVKLRVAETHFAVGSKLPMIELSHLQMGIKLRYTEIDALFLGKMDTEDGPISVIVTCEAKQHKDPFIPEQIINQVRAAFAMTDTDLAIPIDLVIPIGIKAKKGVGLYVVEFEPVKREEEPTLNELKPASYAIYELKPPIKGI